MCRSSELGGKDKGTGDVVEAPGDGVHRVVMWGPPRSLSTAVERALIEHKAVHVLHEPYGLPYYWSSEAGSSREAGDRCKETYRSVSDQIFHDQPPPGKRFVFSKNLSYYFSPHCLPQFKELMNSDYSKARHSFMIRHPAKAISSLYYKSCIDNEKTGYTHFDPVEAGFSAMRSLYRHLQQIPEAGELVVIDADDLLEDPAGVMEAYCAALGLPFDTSMLSWTPGPVPELASPFQGWTDDVQQSSGIQRRAKRSPPPEISSLPQEVQDTINDALPIYEELYARALRGPTGRAAAAEANGHANGNHASNGHAAKGHDVEQAGHSVAAASPCCKLLFDEPAKVSGTVLLLLSVLIWVCQVRWRSRRPRRAVRVRTTSSAPHSHPFGSWLHGGVATLSGGRPRPPRPPNLGVWMPRRRSCCNRSTTRSGASPTCRRRRSNRCGSS